MPMASDDGFYMSYIFFAERPLTGLSFGKDSPDKTVFMGLEVLSSNIPYLRFRRIVKPGDMSGSSYEERHLRSGFLEDRWYAKNIGLVRLKQTVAGRETMLWELNGYKF